MNYYTAILCLILLALGCDHQGSDPQSTVQAYFEARDSRDFSEIVRHVHDSLIITEGDFVMGYDHDSYYEVFKWDSVFHQSYKVVDLESEDKFVLATIKINSIKHEFLKNPDMTCLFRISLIDGNISKLESLDCPDADWVKWSQERDALVSWISEHHPDLDGFINDMSMEGAINYLNAIKLYQEAIK